MCMELYIFSFECNFRFSLAFEIIFMHFSYEFKWSGKILNQTFSSHQISLMNIKKNQNHPKSFSKPSLSLDIFLRMGRLSSVAFENCLFLNFSIDFSKGKFWMLKIFAPFSLQRKKQSATVLLGNDNVISKFSFQYKFKRVLIPFCCLHDFMHQAYEINRLFLLDQIEIFA